MRHLSSRLTLRHQAPSFNHSYPRYVGLHFEHHEQSRLKMVQSLSVWQTGVRQDMLNYRHKVRQATWVQCTMRLRSMCIPVPTCPALQVKVAGGSILVRPLTHAWVHECGALLTGAFADAMGYVPMYRSVPSGHAKASVILTLLHGCFHSACGAVQDVLTASN